MTGARWSTQCILTVRTQNGPFNSNQYFVWLVFIVSIVVVTVELINVRFVTWNWHFKTWPKIVFIFFFFFLLAFNIRYDCDGIHTVCKLKIDTLQTKANGKFNEFRVGAGFLRKGKFKCEHPVPSTSFQSSCSHLACKSKYQMKSDLIICDLDFGGKLVMAKTKQIKRLLMPLDMKSVQNKRNKQKKKWKICVRFFFFLAIVVCTANIYFESNVFLAFISFFLLLLGKLDVSICEIGPNKSSASGISCDWASNSDSSSTWKRKSLKSAQTTNNCWPNNIITCTLCQTTTKKFLW